MDLSNSSLSTSSYKELFCNYIHKLRDLHKLILDQNVMEIKAVEALEKYLKTNPELKELHLNDCGINLSMLSNIGIALT